MDVEPPSFMNIETDMRGSLANIETSDNIFLKQLWKHPIPTNQEIKLFFDLLEDDNPLKVGFGLMLITCARPSEIVNIKWHRFRFDKEQQVFNELYHNTYKPTNRKSKVGRHVYYKEVRKKLSSKWLNELLLNHYKNYSNLPQNKVLPFYTTDSFNKIFSVIRKKIKNKKLSSMYDFLLDTNIQHIKGTNASKTKYRISPYSLRRFGISFLYWSKAPIGFNRDIISLAKYVGHSNPKTTYEHYVYPKESIGLTKEMINNKISLDEFIHLHGKKQSLLNDFIDKKQLLFLDKGQSSLSDFE